MDIGYHASHEQHPPSALLEYVRLAQRAGFDAAMCSDHFNPWSDRQGQSGFAWSWLGAALEATPFTYGTVCAPGQRYHPAVIAQAAATLQEMYEGRFWLALGSGELLNEHITGEGWPSKDERNARLEECAHIIRRLIAGERVDHDGHVRVDGAMLYTRPSTSVPLYGAALTAETAEWLGSWADGLIIASADAEAASEPIEAFRRGGGSGRPVLVQIPVAYADTNDEALAAAHDQWRHAALDPAQLADLPTPQAFDAATADLTPEDAAETLLVSSDPADHIRLLREFTELGVEAVYIHDVALDQRAFIDLYGRAVLPELARSAQRR